LGSLFLFQRNKLATFCAKQKVAPKIGDSAKFARILELAFAIVIASENADEIVGHFFRNLEARSNSDQILQLSDKPALAFGFY
jgi:hypothetical protein